MPALELGGEVQKTGRFRVAFPSVCVQQPLREKVEGSRRNTKAQSEDDTNKSSNIRLEGIFFLFQFWDRVKHIDERRGLTQNWREVQEVCLGYKW